MTGRQIRGHSRSCHRAGELHTHRYPLVSWLNLKHSFIMASKSTSNCYGWVADLPDHRDHVYAAPQKVVSQLPPTADLRKQCPAVYNQGQIGSCTANAISAAVQFTRKKEKHAPDFAPSRLF